MLRAPKNIAHPTAPHHFFEQWARPFSRQIGIEARVASCCFIVAATLCFAPSRTSSNHTEYEGSLCVVETAALECLFVAGGIFEATHDLQEALGSGVGALA